MRHLALLFILALTGLFATDWTPPSIIPIDPSVVTIYKTAVPVQSIYRQFLYYRIPATVASVQASAVPIKSTSQVWAHGKVAYFHGVPVSSESGTLTPGQNPIIDAIYSSDPNYVAGTPPLWRAEFINRYKARWEASYDAAYPGGVGMPATYPVIIFTLKIETFDGLDPMPYPAEHRDGVLVPLPPPPLPAPANN